MALNGMVMKDFAAFPRAGLSPKRRWPSSARLICSRHTPCAVSGLKHTERAYYQGRRLNCGGGHGPLEVEWCTAQRPVAWQRPVYIMRRSPPVAYSRDGVISRIFPDLSGYSDGSDRDEWTEITEPDLPELLAHASGWYADPFGCGSDRRGVSSFPCRSVPSGGEMHSPPCPAHLGTATLPLSVSSV